MANIPNKAQRRITSAVQFVERRDLAQRGLRRRHEVNSPKVLLVKITEQDTTNKSKFAWQQEIRTATDWIAPANGRKGTLTFNPCYHRDPAETTNITSEHVYITRGPVSINGTLSYAWIIVGSATSLASGKYPGTLRQVVAANTDGYDHLHLSSLLPDQT